MQILLKCGPEFQNNEKYLLEICLKDKDDQIRLLLMIIIKNDLDYNWSNALVLFRIKN